MSSGGAPGHASHVLKLGPCEIAVHPGPQEQAQAFALGTLTLLVGGELNLRRFLRSPVYLYVHRGQGRAVVGGRSVVLVPGTMVEVPAGIWHSLKNTGTGAIVMVWVAAPSVEHFWRDSAAVGAAPSAEALREMLERHGVELQEGSAALSESPQPARGRRRRRRRRHGAAAGERGTAASAPAQSVPAPEASADAPASPLAPPSQGARGELGRKPRRRRRRRGGSRAAAEQAGPPKSAPPPAAAEAGKTPRGGRGPRDRDRGRGRGRRRGGRVREVYVEGRWVPVEGGGPVIALGRDKIVGGNELDDRDADR